MHAKAPKDPSVSTLTLKIDDGFLIKQRLLERTMDLYSEGHVGPIHPVTTFEATQVEDAFRHLQKGQHIGKVVVALQRHAEASDARSRRDFALRADVAYVLVGGLGGLGRAVSTWMVECGARHIIYLSRSAGRREIDVTFFDELKDQGCIVQAFSGDVADPVTVRNLVQAAERPIAGVIQMSMVLKVSQPSFVLNRPCVDCLKDSGFEDLSYDDWRAAINPKVTGTVNLHQELSATSLDFFVLFSSLSGTIGQIGQVNYAAANTFLDAFVRYRRNLKLAASVLDIGLVESVGYLSEKPSALRRLQSRGMRSLSESELLGALQLAIVRSPVPDSQSLKTNHWTNDSTNSAKFAIGLSLNVSQDDAKNQTLWRRDVRMSSYANSQTGPGVVGPSATNIESNALTSFLSTLTADQSALDDRQQCADFLAQQISAQLRSLLNLGDARSMIDLDRPLSANGIDSLVSIEIRNWWRHVLRLEIPVFDIINAKSVRHLGEIALDGLKAKHNEERIKPA